MIEFAETGMLQVWRGSVLVSQHRQEREAIESILRDFEAGNGVGWEIRRPTIRVAAKGRTLVLDGGGVLH